jgi:hypothetical protein
VSSHDVRNLGACLLCKELGTFDPKAVRLPLLLILQRDGRGRRTVGAHPRCLLRGDEAHPDIRFITTLGPDEMGKIRRDDLPDRAYRRVIVAHAAQLNGAQGKVSP